MELNPDAPTVLLIGTVDSEGVRSTLKTSGRQYKVKRIDSSVHNWGSICEQFGAFPIRCVLVKLTGTTYSYLADPRYVSSREQLLDCLASVPHALYAYEPLLSNTSERIDLELDEQIPSDLEAESDTLFDYQYGFPPVEVREIVNQMLTDRGFEVVPYRGNAELTVLASSFISDVEDNLLFRVYVPCGKIWANETDRLLQLFQDYLSRVGHRSVRLDQHRTTRGIIYELFGLQGASGSEKGVKEITREFEDFSKFLDLAAIDPAQAEVFLQDRRIDKKEISIILTRYAKEAKRLQVDLRQERELKFLSVRHRLESELVEMLPPDAGIEIIEALVEASIPKIAGVATILDSEQHLLRVSSREIGAVTVNVRPQIIHAVNAVIAQEIHGDVNLTEQDRKLLELIAEHGGDKKSQLTSSVREFADDSAPKAGRVGARQKLKGFLHQLGSKATDMGIGLLQAYLENRLGIS